MTVPEQHTPPVHACAAGSVSHAHAGDALEPAVLLHTQLTPELADALSEPELRVDVHADGPGSPTLTIRVLAEEHAVAWQVPIAPLVAALPGQLGDDGRVVLLAVIDGEPEPGFWARPVDCEHLSAELQLPVTDLVEALHGRLISWLAGDLEELLHLDAHDRAMEHSPAQTVANAVLASYRGDLAAQQHTTHLARALEHAPDDVAVELGARLCAGLAAAVELADAAALTAVRDRVGPFESEVLRLLDELPRALSAASAAEQVDVTMTHVVAGADRDDAVRAAVTLAAGLARQVLGVDRPDDEVLGRLGMVDDAGLLRLAHLWLRLATAAAGVPSRDGAAAAELTSLVQEQGAAGAQWLRSQATTLARLGEEVAGRQRDRVAAPVRAVEQLLTDRSGRRDRAAVGACLTLARFVRDRADLGPGIWLTLAEESAAEAVGRAVAAGAGTDVGAGLLLELIEDDVEEPELLEALICATSHIALRIDPHADPVLRRAQLAEIVAAVPERGGRWLVDACLREAHEHDPMAADLVPLLGPPVVGDPDRAATRAGRFVVVRDGFAVLLAVTDSLGEEAGLSRDQVLSMVLANALTTHGLLRRPADAP